MVSPIPIHKKPGVIAPRATSAPPTLSALLIATQPALDAANVLDGQTALLHTMSVAERSAAGRVVRQFPDSMIGLVAEAARQHEGRVAGVAFDAVEAAAVLDYEAKVMPVVQALLRVAAHLQDDVTQRKVEVCTRTSYVFQVMRSGLRKKTAVAEVVPFKSLFDKLDTEARALKKPRGTGTGKRRSKTAAATGSTAAQVAVTTPATPPAGGASSGSGTPHT